MGNIGNTYIDTFFVRNLTSNPLTLGDLVNCNIPANSTIDLLKVPRVTKEKINQSKNLQTAVRMGVVRIIKAKPTSLSVQEQEMILPDYEDIDHANKNLKSKSVYISSPGASEYIPLWFNEQEKQFIEIRGITDQGTFTFDILHAPAADAFSGGTTINNGVIVADADGQTQSGFISNIVPTNRWIVLESSAATGGVTKLNITISMQNTNA